MSWLAAGEHVTSDLVRGDLVRRDLVAGDLVTTGGGAVVTPVSRRTDRRV
jgi:hypothetical protein